jgi:hypothetical protein
MLLRTVDRRRSDKQGTKRAMLIGSVLPRWHIDKHACVGACSILRHAIARLHIARRAHVCMRARPGVHGDGVQRALWVELVVQGVDAGNCNLRNRVASQ